jgi:hypothetical protein
MATAVEEAQDAQAAQAALITLMIAELNAIWDQLDIASPAETLEQWIEAATAIIEDYAVAMGALAQEMYLAARDDSGAESDYDPAPIEPPSDDEIEEMLRWALSEAWNDGSLDDARDNLEAGAEKLVLDTGRQTTAEAAVEDPQARGWARVARPDACSFCLLLATRGGVYDSHDTATETISGESYHSHCRCVAVPVFEGTPYELPGYLQRWRRIYYESARGYSGKDALNAFRRAVYRERRKAESPEQANA